MKTSKANPLQQKTQSITLIWKNLSASVKDKIILDKAQGYCKPGQMLAIMGPSGAGKTTLLSLLAGKKSSALTIQGQVHANSMKFTAQQYYNFGVYIFQNDILHQMLTVKQTLQFIANLKIKNDQQANQKVNQLIKTFQLQKCQNSYIGGQFKKGISGGQKKRVCIAVEMIAQPALLILDEPTSGLDSSKARSIIKVLKKLAHQQKKTIIFTLHQPSYLIYNQLDRLILLNNGKTIYQGKSHQIKSYMQDKLHIHIPPNRTMSDFFMMQISCYKKQKQNYTSALSPQNYSLYLSSQNHTQIQQAKSQQDQGWTEMQTTRSFWFMLTMLFWREFTIFKRNPMKGIRVIGNSIVMLVLAGLIFIHGISDNRPVKGQAYTMDELNYYFIKAQGVTFVAIVSCIMSSIFSVSLAFPVDRQIYYKQTTSKKYYPSSYLISKVTIQAGSVIVGAIIFSIGEYFMVGFTFTFQQLLKYILILVVCSLVGNSIGIMTGSLFKDAKRASALTPIFLLPMMMFSGLYNKLNSIPIWISWLQYLSPFRYALHSVLLNQFDDERYITKYGLFDYRTDLAIDLSYAGNIVILLVLAAFFYTVSFVCLKKLSSNLAP